jgi:hypothetical protein
MGRLVNIACVTHHGSTLRQLGLASTREFEVTPIHIITNDLKAILTSAPHLEGLAIDLCPIDLGRVRDLGSDFTLQEPAGGVRVPDELESMLNALANHHALRSLRVLSVPQIDFREPPVSSEDVEHWPEDSQVLASQVIMQKFSTEVVRYLTAQGSFLNVFGICPDQSGSQRPIYDRNGHQWPQYFYLRGRTMNSRGIDSIVALPTRIFDEEPPYTVFNYRFLDDQVPE